MVDASQFIDVNGSLYLGEDTMILEYNSKPADLLMYILIHHK